FQRGDIFSLFTNAKREFNSYRVGADIDAMGFRLTFLHTWEFYKDDTPYSIPAATAGFNPTDPSTLASFNRASPQHRPSPSWLVTLGTERKYFAANARFTNSAGKLNFIQQENAVGNGLAGSVTRIISSSGDARRPVTTGDLNLSVFPTSRLTITNNTSVDD